jgi:hypothetical protein
MSENFKIAKGFAFEQNICFIKVRNTLPCRGQLDCANAESRLTQNFINTSRATGTRQTKKVTAA